MKTTKTPFLSLIVKLGGPDLRPDQLPVDAANRLRRVQLRRTIEQMRLMLACNTLFAPVLSFQAWNSGINAAVLIWTAAIVVFSWLLFFDWKRTYRSDGTAEDMRRFVVQTFFNASFWAVGMVLFYPVVQGEQKAVVTAVMAGSLALGTVGFSQAPSAAFVYLGVLTVGNTLVALICGILTGLASDWLIAFLSLAAGASVFNATLERGKSSVTAFKNHENLSEKTEVVELLLKDYETQATEWLWQTDVDGNLIRAPQQVSEMLRMSEDTLACTTLVRMVSAKTTAEAQPEIERLRAAFLNRQEFHDFQFPIVDAETSAVRWILMKGRPQFASGEFSGFRGIFADATESVEAERKVQFLAAYDSLTHLYNRESTHKRLADLKSGRDFTTAFLIDLDGFKQVNDSYGHHVGDRLLRDAAERLRHAQSGQGFAARLGGDEFFVLLTDDRPFTDTTIACFADEIVDSLSQPFQVEDFNLQLSASIGVARFPNDTTVGQDLLLLADLALYKAKNQGRNRFEFFHEDMQTAQSEKVAITEKLRQAVHDDKIMQYYQSQHALSDGRLIGFEALARWIDTDLGFVGPDIFIPIAEQTGLIVPLGEQLLRKACTDACYWIEVLGDRAPVLSVNFSPVQFARTDVAALVKRTLKETGYPPQLLEVEITEGVLISNKEMIAQTLRELSDFGVSIALDDFGTGYSSLSYLNELPLDRLKIDRSFVCDTDENSDAPIVRSIIQLGHSLGLTVIAEGIEDQFQSSRLAAMGCDDGQGYFYSRPLPLDDANAFVRQTAAAQGIGKVLRNSR